MYQERKRYTQPLNCQDTTRKQRELETYKDDYQYLVVYYAKDCTKLDQNRSLFMAVHFLWQYIQMSKGKANKDY